MSPPADDLGGTPHERKEVKMYYWVCVRNDATGGLFEVKTDDKFVSYEDFCQIKNECRFTYAETVTFEFRGIKYMMLIDEEGKMKENCRTNSVASIFWNNPHDVIVGDVAVLGYPDGEEMCYLTREEADNVFNYLKNEVKRVVVETPFPL